MAPATASSQLAGLQQWAKRVLLAELVAPGDEVRRRDSPRRGRVHHGWAMAGRWLGDGWAMGGESGSQSSMPPGSERCARCSVAAGRTRRCGSMRASTPTWASVSASWASSNPPLAPCEPLLFISPPTCLYFAFPGAPLPLRSNPLPPPSPLRPPIRSALAPMARVGGGRGRRDAIIAGGGGGGVARARRPAQLSLPAVGRLTPFNVVCCSPRVQVHVSTLMPLAMLFVFSFHCQLSLF
ncbi:unnamed protein product [Closterium sp. Naga37s-1]|nr:unnamed protein product [Closterium sp. Naga37s-1]